VQDVDTEIAFSADGRQIAYVRGNDPEVGKFQLLIANPDGTNEKVFSSGPSNQIPLNVSWLPDGKQIASVFPGTGALSMIQFQDVATAKVRALVPLNKIQINDMAWLPGGRGLVVSYQNNSTPTARVQIGYLLRDGTGFRTITNDTNSYRTLTLSADGNTLATVQQKSARTLYLLPASRTAGNPPIPAAAQLKDSFLFHWAANGDLYFTDGASLLRMSPDGATKNTVFSDPTSIVLAGRSCADAGYVILEREPLSGAGKTNIWRTSSDGSGLKQLTNGVSDLGMRCTAGAKWVYYEDWVNARILRVSIDGGTPEPVPGTAVPNTIFTNPGFGVSNDGKWLAVLVIRIEPNADAEKIALVPLDAGSTPAVQLLDPDPRIASNPQFTPDGSAMVYGIRQDGVDNLWLQPLDGSGGRQITNFQSDAIQNFEFSPDGKTLGVYRLHSESDVVLLHDSGGTNP
jgi:eukaryotic-like serine/threonine-protein kinase